MRVNDIVRHVGLRTDRPWLVLGKGPSADRLDRVPAYRYHVFALNHACTVCDPAVAHFTDLEAFLDCCRDAGVAQGQAVCLPWHPHLRMKPGREQLAQIASNSAETASAPLRAVAEAGRLYSYNSTLAAKLEPNPRLPEVRVRLFSAVAAVNILAAAGIKAISLLGVDGGTGYAKHFDPKDRLANGRKSFDGQFAEIGRTVAAHAIWLTNLGA